VSEAGHVAWLFARIHIELWVRFASVCASVG